MNHHENNDKKDKPDTGFPAKSYFPVLKNLDKFFVFHDEIAPDTATIKKIKSNIATKTP